MRPLRGARCRSTRNKNRLLVREIFKAEDGEALATRSIALRIRREPLPSAQSDAIPGVGIRKLHVPANSQASSCASDKRRRHAPHSLERFSATAPDGLRLGVYLIRRCNWNPVKRSLRFLERTCLVLTRNRERIE